VKHVTVLWFHHKISLRLVGVVKIQCWKGGAK